MANCVIAYNPCFSCDEKKCEICELDMHRKGVFQQSEVIDEFVERLKKRLYDKPSIFTQQRYIVNDEIDKLVEEMKGGAE